MVVRKLLVAAMAMLVAGLPVARAQSQGSISIGLAEAPTNRADDPRAKVYIVDHLHQDVIERGGCFSTTPGRAALRRDGSR